MHDLLGSEAGGRFVKDNDSNTYVMKRGRLHHSRIAIIIFDEPTASLTPEEIVR